MRRTGSDERLNRDHYDRVWNASRDPCGLEQMAQDPRTLLLEPLRGRRLLDLGCGRGEWSVFLAFKGAVIAAVDISWEGVRSARASAQASGCYPRVCAAVASAYRLPFPENTFDLVHGQFILHHLNVETVGWELRRVLKPGGIAVFKENSANNKILMAARKLCGHFGIPKWSVPGEHPLRRKEVDRLAQILGRVETIYHEFCCFGLLGEKVFGGWSVMRRLDRAIYARCPHLRQYGYTQLLRFVNAKQA